MGSPCFFCSASCPGALSCKKAAPGPPQRTPKYASTGRMRASYPVVGSWPLRNHLEVFGKGVQFRETRDFAKGFFPWRSAF